MVDAHAARARFCVARVADHHTTDASSLALIHPTACRRARPIGHRPALSIMADAHRESGGRRSRAPHASPRKTSALTRLRGLCMPVPTIIADQYVTSPTLIALASLASRRGWRRARVEPRPGRVARPGLADHRRIDRHLFDDGAFERDIYRPETPSVLVSPARRASGLMITSSGSPAPDASSRARAGGRSIPTSRA